MHTENGSYAGSVYAWINSGAVLRERTAALYAGERHIRNDTEDWRQLMKTYYRVQADIDLDAIYKNAENAKKLTKPGTKFMAIVKADAYGHGAIPVAKVLDPIADAYGVAILEEGIELRQAGITKPILILGFTPASLYPSMIEYDIATAVFQYDMAKKM